MVGWHHRLNGHEFEQALGDSEGQGSLACCSPQGHKESDNLETEQQLCVKSIFSFNLYTHFLNLALLSFPMYRSGN